MHRQQHMSAAICVGSDNHISPASLQMIPARLARVLLALALTLPGRYQSAPTFALAPGPLRTTAFQKQAGVSGAHLCAQPILGSCWSCQSHLLPG